MQPSADLTGGLVAWIAIVVLVVLVQRRAVGPGTSLVLSFLFGQWLMHWTGALLYTLPWYWYQDTGLVRVGFQQSLYAVLAFGAGVLALTLLRRHRPTIITPQAPAEHHSITPMDAGLPRAYLLVGIASYLVLFPLSGLVPSLSAIASMSNLLVIVGLGLYCWRAWREGNHRVFALSLAAGILLPLFTIVTWGFLGFGAMALFALLAFVSGFVRLRARVVVVFLLAGFVGLSFYVTYMRDRVELRASVWGGQSLEQRLGQIGQMISTFEWFDLWNNAHLHRIDDRLNQNVLLGAAVRNLEAGYVDYARGATLDQAAVALIPRIIWPDKPIRAGGSSLVTSFTGIAFASGTTVGVGQLMEFYINFGTPGVIVGFFLLGLVIAGFDRAAAMALQRGDWRTFAFWYLGGLGFLQANGALFEITASVAGGLVAAILVNRFVLSAISALGRRSRPTISQPLPPAIRQ
jgi:hypothetical protein